MAFTPRQFAFRFYNADGNENTATAAAAQDANLGVTGVSNERYHLRFGFEETGGTGGSSTDDWQLQYEKNDSGSWVNVTTSSSNVRAFDSANITDGAFIANLLTGGTGTQGFGHSSEDGLVDNSRLGPNTYYEHLYTIEFVAADIAGGNTFDFRVVLNGSVLAGGYATTPRATIAFNETITESATPGDSLTATLTMPVTISESSTPADVYVTASNANIHAFTRLPYGEIWFVIPTGAGESHTYFTFCVDESQRAQAPVWFKGGINATAVLDDAKLGTDEPWSCLRIADGASADLVSFDRRADGTMEVDWNLTSSAFYIDEAERRVLIKRYYKDFEDQDNNVTLQLLTYDFPSGSNIASPSLTIGTSDTTKDFRVSGRLMKMKFSGSGQCRLGKSAFDVVSLGER